MALVTRFQTVVQVILLTFGASSFAGADPLNLEQDGARQIMAKIKATLTVQTAQAEEPQASGFSYRVNNIEYTVDVTERLPARIRADGEDMDFALYQAQVNGDAAVLALGPDTMHLSYRSDEQPTAYRVSFDQHSASQQQVTPEQAHSPAEGGHSLDIELTTPQALMPSQAELHADALAASDQPILVYVFKHNDVREDIPSLTREHFSWWVQEMNNINKQHIAAGNTPLFSEIVVDFRSDKTIQNFAYQGEPVKKLRELADEFRDYKYKHLPGSSHRRTKFLLLTEYQVDWVTLGIAYLGGQYGIASDNTDQVAAHELGHMFNGRHEHAEIIYNGWWCESTLYWQHVFLRSSCHKYTDANKRAITNYLR